MRLHYTAFMIDRLSCNKTILNFDQCCIKLECAPKNYDQKVVGHYLITVEEGVNYSLSLRISS